MRRLFRFHSRVVPPKAAHTPVEHVQSEQPAHLVGANIDLPCAVRSAARTIADAAGGAHLNRVDEALDDLDFGIYANDLTHFKLRIRLPRFLEKDFLDANRPRRLGVSAIGSCPRGSGGALEGGVRFAREDAYVKVSIGQICLERN